MRHLILPIALVAVAGCDMAVPDLRPSADSAPVTAAAPVPAQPVSAKERFVSAAEANGCVLNADNVSAVMAEAQLSAGDLENILPSLVDEGRATLGENDSFRLTTANCVA